MNSTVIRVGRYRIDLPILDVVSPHPTKLLHLTSPPLTARHLRSFAFLLHADTRNQSQSVETNRRQAS